MPILINELIEDAKDIINTSQTGMLDADLGTRLANVASRWAFGDLTGHRAQYKDGFAESRTGGFQKTHKITDDLHPFIKRVVLVVDGQGRMIRPTDYAYWAGMRMRFDKGELFKCVCKKDDELCSEFKDDPTEKTINQKLAEELLKIVPESDVDLISISEVAGRTQSTIYKPSTRYPVCYPFTIENADVNLNTSYFQLLPKSVGTAILTYLRFPKPCVYATALNIVFNRDVFDPTNSINLEWNVTMKNDLAQKIAQLFGQWIDKPELFATTTAQINSGA